MSKEQISKFLKSKFFIFCFIYIVTFLIAGFNKYLEIALIPVLIVAFIMLSTEEDFYFFLFTQTLQLSTLFIRTSIVAEVIYISVLLIKFVLGVKAKKYELNSRLLISIGAFTAFTTIVSCFNHMALYSISYLFYLPFFYLIFCTRKEYNFKKLLRIFAFSLIISSIVSLITPILPHYNISCIKHEGETLRFKGFFGSANTLYMFAILISSCYLYLFLAGKIKMPEFLIVYGAMGIITLSTLSKAGILVFAIITLIGIITYLSKDFKHRYWHVGILLLGLAICLLIFKDVALKIVSRYFKNYENDAINSLLTGRLDIWKAYIDSIFKSFSNVMFGRGLLSRYVYVPIQGQERAHHNLYIFLMDKFGIVGLVLLVLVVREFIISYRKISLRFINFIPLIYFLIEGLCDNAFMQTQFYIIIAMVLVDSFVKKTTIDTSKNQNDSIDKNVKDEKVINKAKKISLNTGVSITDNENPNDIKN